MTDRVLLFDTTLRDGEQSPGVSLTPAEKLQIARHLAQLGVDIVEAGFPVASKGDFEAVQRISREVPDITVAALARTMPTDIDRAWEAVQRAAQPRIHTFISTSPLHMHDMLNLDERRVLELSVAAVKRAVGYTSDVEFSAQDATRSEFLVRLFEAVIAAGATTINIPDTVGYSVPGEFATLVRRIIDEVPNIDRAVVSVHCHNDLGLAVSNSLAAVGAGARQVEVTVNGIGERAGNLEEVVMALRTRGDLFGVTTGIQTERLYRMSRLVSQLTGMSVQANKAIVGEHAFAHESGIHQAGVLKNPVTYEIMTPESVGFKVNRLVLGKHSGRHALRNRLHELGYNPDDEALNRLFLRFKALADRKKGLTDRDIDALARDELYSSPERYRLVHYHVSTGDTGLSTASVELECDDTLVQEAAVGDGPVNALYHALDRALGASLSLVSYSIQAVTGGADALGEVRVQLSTGERTAPGSAVSASILEASIRAYLSAAGRLGLVENHQNRLLERQYQTEGGGSN